jgi:hypothetical protein
MATIKYKDGADWKYLPLGGPSSVLMDTWHVAGAAGEPAFQTPWIQDSPIAQSARFRKYPDGKVRLAGLVKAGANWTFASNANLFVLPAGYRPVGNHNCLGFHFDSSDGSVDPVRVVILTTGQIYVGAVSGAGYSGIANSEFNLDGIEFDTETVAMFPMAGIGLPPRVTTLPSSPSDGQEVYYVASAANGVLWHLKYNAASASAYKWEFVGGSRWGSQDSTVVALNNASMIELSPNISITLPLAGDYELGVEGTGTRIGSGAADFQCQPSITAAVLTPWGNPARFLGTGLGAPNDTITIKREGVAQNLVANSRIAWFGLAGNLNIYHRKITAVPVRVV